MAPFVPSILLVDDSESFRRSVATALRTSYDVRLAGSVEEAISLLAPPPDAVLLDLRLGDDEDGGSNSLELLQRLRRDLPHVAVIMITAYGDVETAVECMRLGALDFIEKGGDLRELNARIEKALEIARASSRLSQLEQELAVVAGRTLVGESVALQRVTEMIAAVAHDASITVLITGETGTGKELVARSVHATGPRAGQPFVGVALAALPESVMEGELFGYEPGAFTDARRRHIGLVERAHKGVLFLDEIGELSPHAQVKLLRFLEERVISRLGGTRDIPVDVQVVAATNANLPDLIRTGRFRQDLYYRLKVCEIRVPPLRERRDDIAGLVEHYLRMFGAKTGSATISARSLEALTAYSWPGNIRELRNALESAVLTARLRQRRVVEEADLPEEIRAGHEHQHAVADSRRHSISSRSLDEALAQTELEYVEEALRKSQGRKAEAAKQLGLNDRFVFARRMRRICERFPGLVNGFPRVRHAFCRDNGDDMDEAVSPID
jgi:DNA-binding NtrC family response regulator